jgi:hypothetical protein
MNLIKSIKDRLILHSVVYTNRNKKKRLLNLLVELEIPRPLTCKCRQAGVFQGKDRIRKILISVISSFETNYFIIKNFIFSSCKKYKGSKKETPFRIVK